jgi:uncharacterized membrane protein
VPSLPLHPALVHLPIGLSLVVPLIALGVLVAVRRRALPARAWVLVVALQALVFAGGLAAAQAGERDQARVERLVGRHFVHDHEERAEAFLWVAGATVAVAAAPLALASFPTLFMAAAVTGSVATAGLALYAGEAGGALVYAHGARGAATAFVPGSAPAPIAVEEGGEQRSGRSRESGRD